MTNSLLRLPEGNDALFDTLAADLIDRGYSIQPDALPPAVSRCLAARAGELAHDEYQKAAIGRGTDTMRNRFIRQNRIHWLDERDAVLQPWHDWTSALRVHLNRRLFLGLFSFESHFTLYEQGDFYKRHMDAFRGERNRIVSLVTYLNEGWQPDQGGELVLYPPEGEAIRVSPAFGTVALFLSEEIPHEVLPVFRNRYGLAGWFRLNSSTNNIVDPPR